MHDTNKRPLTGKHMAMIFVGGFGVVIAVNMLMASFAVGSFHGTVVDNSYVASQKFNGWMAEAEKSRDLGWKITGERLGDGRIALAAHGVPDGATIAAIAERPLGKLETHTLTFARADSGEWESHEVLPAGRWNLVVEAASGTDGWSGVIDLQ